MTFGSVKIMLFIHLFPLFLSIFTVTLMTNGDAATVKEFPQHAQTATSRCANYNRTTQMKCS